MSNPAFRIKVQVMLLRQDDTVAWTNASTAELKFLEEPPNAEKFAVEEAELAFAGACYGATNCIQGELEF